MVPVTKDRVLRWSGFVRRVRDFLEARGFFEVTTDHLVPAGAFEGTIDTLKVTYRGGSGELHTSPEIEMKRLLSQTHLPIFQICRCFRDDPPTGIHLKEFTMLEFYRVDATYEAIMGDVRDLLSTVAGVSVEIEELTIRELVQKYAGFDLATTPTRDSLLSTLREGNLASTSDDDTWEELFFKLMIERIEPSLPEHRPVLVRDYPLELAALAKRSPAGDTVERFEIYWQGMELCNGCTELEDLVELRARFEKEQAGRQAQGKEAHPFPERLLDAMEHDFPRSAGVAVGLERLFWALEKCGLI